MAVLTTQQRSDVFATMSRKWSRERISTAGVTKSEFLTLVDECDDALETAETTIVAALTGALRTLVLANQSLARQVVVEVMKARQENL